VPLHIVLKKAGLRPDALQIVFRGADVGTESDHPEPMHFERSLPLDKALHADTLLALEMNGEPLEPNHGFPVRLLVPGWYGVASVKWLSHVEVVNQPFTGYFQTKKYTIKRPVNGTNETVIVQRMAVKSAIIRPANGDVLQTGTQRVFGVAWAGEEQIRQVEVSTDGGEHWHSAELLGPHAPYSWTLWEYSWEVNSPGSYTILSRAVSASGEIQPHEHDSLNGGYMIHFVQPVEVTVTSAMPVPAPARDAETLLYDMNAFAVANAQKQLDVNLEYSFGAGI
jgi:DMSO/TMAO reductase YedYZ molybdopterin-dependent catalytic subunit